MHSVWSDVYEVHFFRVHHDFWMMGPRDYNARTRRFRLPYLGCAIQGWWLKRLDFVYREDLRERERFLRYFGVRQEDLGGKNFWKIG